MSEVWLDRLHMGLFKSQVRVEIGMKELDCPRCGHVWNYSGHSKKYVSCPNCYNRFKLTKD